MGCLGSAELIILLAITLWQEQTMKVLQGCSQISQFPSDDFLSF